MHWERNEQKKTNKINWGLVSKFRLKTNANTNIPKTGIIPCMGNAYKTGYWTAHSSSFAWRVRNDGVVDKKKKTLKYPETWYLFDSIHWRFDLGVFFLSFPCKCVGNINPHVYKVMWAHFRWGLFFSSFNGDVWCHLHHCCFETSGFLCRKHSLGAKFVQTSPHSNALSR